MTRSIRWLLSAGICAVGLILISASSETGSTNQAPATDPVGPVVNPSSSPAAPPAAGHATPTAPIDNTKRDAVSAPPAPLPHAFVVHVEQAHGRDAWLRQSGVEFDLLLIAENGNRMRATVLYDIINDRTRINLPNSLSFVFDGRHTWSIPPDTAVPDSPATFKSWHRLLTLPFRLRGNAAVCEPQGAMQLDGRPHEVARFTGIDILGDERRIDHWYFIVADARTHLIHSMVSMLTVVSTDAQGQRTMTPIGLGMRFDDFIIVDDVTLPSTWRVSRWSQERGLDPKPALVCQVSNLRFLEPPADAFIEPVREEQQMPAPFVAP